MNGEIAAWRQAMRSLYDEYFASQDYARRYPRPNAGTLDFLWRHGVARARQVLDLGCGNGRYAIPVLEAGASSLVGCDISRAAIEQFAHQLAGHPAQARARLVVGGLESLSPHERFDRVLMLFGVLSHVGPGPDRVALLRRLRDRMTADGALVLSVPSVWRRRPGAVMRSLLCDRGPDLGDIRFCRRIAGRDQTFFYHLYTLRGLRRELAQAGWRLVACEAESLLPEWLVTQSRALGWLDRRLQPVLPAALGYGIRVLARPTQD